jgi:hypothetical protein
MLEEKEHYGILSIIMEWWKFPHTCNQMIEMILTVQNDLDYSLEKEDVEDELWFLQNINSYKIQTSE